MRYVFLFVAITDNVSLTLTSLHQSSDESEEERAKEEERKAEEERNKKEPAASTKGSSTPSGRPKHTNPLKKGTAAQPRKRLGSPNASDASGTDTSRKKTKSKHLSTQQPTSQPGSRPLSPATPSSAPVSFHRTITNRLGKTVDLILIGWKKTRKKCSWRWCRIYQRC